jgi:hypothetical protein
MGRRCRQFPVALLPLRLLPLKLRYSVRVAVLRLFMFQLILIASGAWGQDASTGALRGVVLDALGAVITDADIVAIRVETGIRYHSATDSAGRFVLDLLPAGQYSARAEAEGMSPEISPMIRVEIGSSAQLTFTGGDQSEFDFGIGRCQGNR